MSSHPSKKTFRTEAEWKLKLKEIVREFQKKKLFYATHSKFATYMDEDYLDCFKTEMVVYSKKWIRLAECGMSADKIPGKETHLNTRLLHMIDCGVLAGRTTHNLLLNEKVAEIIGMGHDLGHDPYGHAGERMLAEDLENEGIASNYHPTVAGLVLEQESIQEKTLRLLEKKKGRKLTPREKQEYNKYYLYILDGIAAHNGEGVNKQLLANRKKTIKDIIEDLYKCFTEPESRKKYKPKLVEGAIVRFLDVISYVAKDSRDGALSLGTKNLNNREYEKIFRLMGIPREIIDAEHSKKDLLVEAITEKLRQNLEDCSRGIDGAKMSMAGLMFKLRSLNYDKSNIPRAKKIVNILEERVPLLIDKYTQYLLTPESLNAAPDKEKVASFIKTIQKKSPEKLNRIHARIVREGIEKSVRREIKAILEGDEKAKKTKRRKRLEKDLSLLKIEKGDIKPEVLEGYIKRVLKEIYYLSPEGMNRQFAKYIKAQYPDLDESELAKKIEENSDLKFKTYKECLARFKTAMYFANTSHTYFLDMLQSEGLLTEDERKQQYVTGGQDTSMTKTKEEQAQAMLEEKMDGERG